MIPTPLPNVLDRVAAVAAPLPLSAVRLLDGPFRAAQQRDAGFLLSLDVDRLLHTFRLNAGLPSDDRPYGGWEAPSCEVRGHSSGHYLSACAQMFATTGDERFRQRAERMVAGFAECQAALAAHGSHPGYLSAFPESFIDRVERYERVWAPYYTLHKLLAGLIDAYELCSNEQALGCAKKFADWVYWRNAKLNPEQRERMLGNEHGGMMEALANLYTITKDPRHLETAHWFDHHAVLDPLARGEDKLDGLHANTQIPKMIGAARLYELTGDQRYKVIAETGWERVALHRSYVIGGHSFEEMFRSPEHMSEQLGPECAETCNSYNMLKLSRHIFAWEPFAPVMDFYERALYNHILASEDGKFGLTTYYHALDTGRFKTFATPENSFWCCTGTGMENHAKYGETIVFVGPQDLYLNLFIASKIHWDKAGVTIVQETKFPDEQASHVTLHCREAITFTLWVRRPKWAGEGYAVRVNGEPVDVGAPGAYVPIDRTWRDGDRIDIQTPFALRCESMPDNPKIAAVCYGPLVLAGDLGCADMPEGGPYSSDPQAFFGLPCAAEPRFSGSTEELVAALQPVDGQPNTFTLPVDSPGGIIMLRPYYEYTSCRFIMYWRTS